jgi:hypothetical protein
MPTPSRTRARRLGTPRDQSVARTARRRTDLYRSERIRGNTYRLVAQIKYGPLFLVFIRFVGTHAEYDRIDARKEQLGWTRKDLSLPRLEQSWGVAQRGREGRRGRVWHAPPNKALHLTAEVACARPTAGQGRHPVSELPRHFAFGRP